MPKDTGRKDTGKTEKPLYIVNGKEMPPGWDFRVLPASKIKSVDVYRADMARPKWGKKGANGVVVITMKEAGVDWSKEKLPANVAYYHAELLPQIPKIPGQPLLFVNGREEPFDSLRTLNPNMIKSITVLKDSSARADYGEKGRNGVLLVTLKSSEAGGHVQN